MSGSDQNGAKPFPLTEEQRRRFLALRERRQQLANAAQAAGAGSAPDQPARGAVKPSPMRAVAVATAEPEMTPAVVEKSGPANLQQVGAKIAPAPLEPHPVPATQPAQAPALQVPSRRTKLRGFTFGRIIRISFLLLVLIPTAGVALFYCFVAADQYATVSSFAVRGAASTSGGSNPIASILGGGGGQSSTPDVADSFILTNFIQSREVVQALIDKAHFLEVYSRPEADFYYKVDPNAPIEKLVDYWKRMSSVDFDMDTGIITLTVRAFRPADAQKITDVVIAMSEQLVNQLSARARDDALRSAKGEVARAEARYRQNRVAIASYRDKQLDLDPTATATSQQNLIGSLRQQLATEEAELTALRTTMSADAPRVLYIRNQISAMKKQIASLERAETKGNPDDPRQVLTDRLSHYEELQSEHQFALSAYQSALSSLEAARMAAQQQQRFLAVFVGSSLPEFSSYPQAVRWTLIFGICALCGWGLLAAGLSTVRDHML